MIIDCGQCLPCLDKIKFGGKNSLRKRCVHKVCPIQEKLKQELEASKQPEISESLPLNNDENTIKKSQNTDETIEKTNEIITENPCSSNGDNEFGLVFKEDENIFWPPIENKTNDDKPFMCNVCEYSFGQIEELTSHLSTVHESNTENEPSHESITEENKETFNDSLKHSDSLALNDTKESMNDSKVESPDSKVEIPNSKVESKNTKAESPLSINSTRFQCSYCDSNYAQKTNLYTHVKQKHEENFDAWKLANNLNSSTNKESAKAFQCPYCESKYSHKYNLKAHIKKFHNEKFESTDFRKMSSIDTQTMSEKKEGLNNDDSLTSESLNRKRKSVEISSENVKKCQISSENVKKGQISSENVKKSRRISNAPKKFEDFEMGNEENQPPPTEENMFEPDQENSNAPKDLVSHHQNREMGGPTNQNVVTLMKVMSEDDL